jgi:hypothetical protein
MTDYGFDIFSAFRLHSSGARHLANFKTNRTVPNMKNLLIPVAAALIALATPALAAESIVGSWDNEDCSRPMRIGPMSLQANETVCHFDSVKRKGDTVTWKGECDGEARTVTADLSGGKLFVFFDNGNSFVNLNRCGKASAKPNKCRPGTVSVTFQNGEKACIKKSVYNQAKKTCDKIDSPVAECLCEDGGAFGACGD